VIRLTDVKTSQLTLPLLIALVAMVVDHVGVIFFPDLLILRYIGRLTFPIIAYQLVKGYQHTKHLPNYYARLWLFGLFSQIGYTLAFDTYHFNTLFTLLLGLCLLHSIDKKHWEWLGLMTVIAVLSYRLDYGVYGVILPTLLHVTLSRTKVSLQPIMLMIAYVWWTGVFIYVNALPLYQMIGGLGVLIYHYGQDIVIATVPRFFFYVFYGTHLILLFIIMMLLLY